MLIRKIETYMVIPSKVPVKDDGSSKTPSWVNPSSCNGNGSQMDQKHSKSNGKWSQNLQSYPTKKHIGIGVSQTLRISQKKTYI